MRQVAPAFGWTSSAVAWGIPAASCSDTVPAEAVLGSRQSAGSESTRDPHLEESTGQREPPHIHDLRILRGLLLELLLAPMRPSGESSATGTSERISSNRNEHVLVVPTYLDENELEQLASTLQEIREAMGGKWHQPELTSSAIVTSRFHTTYMGCPLNDPRSFSRHPSVGRLRAGVRIHHCGVRQLDVTSGVYLTSSEAE